jgi:hypothetical protein
MLRADEAVVDATTASLFSSLLSRARAAFRGTRMGIG